MLLKDHRIVIKIEDYPMRWPLEMRKGGEVVFPSEFDYVIPEVAIEGTEECATIIHHGCTGSMSIKQIEEQFNLIIAYLKRRRMLFESVKL